MEDKRITKYLIVVLFALLLLSAIISKAAVSFNYALHSDNVEPGVVFLDMEENLNYLLKGWHLTLVSYLFTDYPIYFIFGSLFGMTPIVLKVGSYFIFAISVLLLCAIVYKAFGREAAALSALALFAMPLYPSIILSQPYIHVGTIAFSFLGLLVLDAIRSREGKTNVSLYALLFVISALGIFSDPLLTFTFTAPAATSLVVLRVFRKGPFNDRKTAAVLLSLALSAAAVLLLYKAVALVGLCIHKNQVSTNFIAHSEAIGSLSQYISLIFTLFDMDLLAAGQDVSNVIFRAINLVLFLITCIGAVLIIKKEKDGGKIFILLYLAMLPIILSLAFLAKVKEPGDSPARYLTPLVYVSSVFFALLISGRYGVGRNIRIALAGIFILTALNNINKGLEFRGAETRREELVGFLKSHNLVYGYAEYWDSNIITFLSGGRVKVRPFIYDKSLILPRYWVSKDDWYFSSLYDGPTFLMLSPDLPEFKKIYEKAMWEFGNPARHFQFDDKHIFVWPHNIMKSILQVKLSRQTPHTTGGFEGNAEGGIMHSLKGEKGDLVYGEYIHMPKDDPPPIVKMRAIFDIQVEGEQGKDAAIITVNIRGSDAKLLGKVIDSRSRTIKAGEGTGPKKYIIEFEADSNGRPLFECVVHPTGEADVKVLWIAYETLNSGDTIWTTNDK